MARMVVDALPSLAYVVVMRGVGAQYADVTCSVWQRDRDVVVYTVATCPELELFSSAGSKRLYLSTSDLDS